MCVCVVCVSEWMNEWMNKAIIIASFPQKYLFEPIIPKSKWYAHDKHTYSMYLTKRLRIDWLVGLVG